MIPTSVRLAAIAIATAASVTAVWPDRQAGSRPDHGRATPPAAAPQRALPALPTTSHAAAPRASQAMPVAIVPMATAVVAAAPAVPYSYVGSWSEGARLHLQLKRGGVNFHVDAPGRLDDEYLVLAADRDRVSLKYLPLGTVHVIRREALQPMQRTLPPQVHTPAAANSEQQAEN